MSAGASALTAFVGGRILDGGGAPARRGSVVVRGGCVEAVLPAGAPPPEAAQRIPCEGLVVAPGFIDVHAHGDLEPFAVPGADGKLCNGVTTEVCGNCGSTPFPLAEYVPGYLREKAERLGVAIDWHSAEEYFQRLDAAPAAINRLFLVGHGRLRGNVLGGAGRPATPKEVDAMAEQLARALADGAWGLSTGLMYPPGCHAEVEELIALARVVAAEDGLYCTHLRSESEGILTAVEEALTIGRAAGVPVHISHLKISGEPNWERLPALRDRLQRALTEGQELHADWYPYEAWNANLDSLLPNWVYEGGTARLLSRLRDPAMRHRLADHILTLSRNGVSWERIIVARVTLPEHRRFQGRPVAEIAAAIGLSPEDTLFNLILAEGGRAEGFMATMSRAVQAEILSWPFVSIGSDAAARAFTGPTAATFPHPRTFGTATRVLRLVREEKVLGLAEAVHRMTGLPARQLGLDRRGRLAPGACADVVVFDPEGVTDTATYREPVQRPRGILHVMVNGVMARRDGVDTECRGGRLLRRGRDGRTGSPGQGGPA